MTNYVTESNVKAICFLKDNVNNRCNPLKYIIRKLSETALRRYNLCKVEGQLDEVLSNFHSNLNLNCRVIYVQPVCFQTSLPWDGLDTLW